jgi:hypothetical protein
VSEARKIEHWRNRSCHPQVSQEEAPDRDPSTR